MADITELINKYGSSGGTSYSLWEDAFNEIQKKKNFSSASSDEIDNELRQLKQNIIAAFEVSIHKEIISGRVFWILVCIPCLCIFLVGLFPSPAVPSMTFLISILAAIGVKKGWQGGLQKYRDAVKDFDDKYFGGELLYKWKKHIPL